MHLTRWKVESSPCDAGSSLLLARRAAQEMCGLQSAAAVPAAAARQRLARVFRGRPQKQQVLRSEPMPQ